LLGFFDRFEDAFFSVFDLPLKPIVYPRWIFILKKILLGLGFLSSIMALENTSHNLVIVYSNDHLHFWLWLWWIIPII
jgi:hypothetical protein